MAKRFTDTGKYDKAWFRNLSPKLKCAWDVLLHKCDHAGVWSIDMEGLSFYVGESVSLQEVLSAFDSKIEVCGDKIIIPSFVEFQYSSLNPSNKVHNSVIQRLQKVRQEKDHTSPLQGSKETETDTDKETETDKETITELSTVSDELNASDRKAAIELAKNQWFKTLSHFGVERNFLIPGEDLAIFAALKQYPVEIVCHAISGMRFEESTPSYNPKKHIRINRAFHPELIQTFVNLSLQKQGEVEKKRAQRQPAQLEPIAATVSA